MPILPLRNASDWLVDATRYSFNPSVGGGTVTQVDASGGTTGLLFTGGPITTNGTLLLSGTLNVANGGLGIVSGTSGGVLGFTGATTLASSIALTANALILGGGAGATPTPLGSLGTTTTVLHGNAAGAPTFGAVSLTADVSGILTVPSGGSGAATLTGLLRGNGVGAFTGSAQASLTTEVTGVLPYANGGTNASTAWSQGYLFFGGASAFAQDTTASNMLFWDATNHRLGIGTTTPPSKLSVVGTIEITAGSGGVLKFADGTSQSSAAAGGGTVTGTGTATNVAFWSAGSTISSDNALYWDNVNKRLGLGTNSPLTRLTFGASDQVQFLGGNPVIVSEPVAGAATTLTLQAASSGAFGFPANGAQIRIESDASANGIVRFATTQSGIGNFERMRIDNLGQVGINQATPTAVLEVKDNTSTCLRLSGSTSGYVGLRPAAVAGTVTYTLPSADSTGTQYLRSNGAGVLTWGTPAGAGTVTTNGALSAGMVTFIDPGGATVITGEGNLFYDNTNNRLGILTSAPIAPLHVGAQTNAPVLTSQILVDVAGSAYITTKDTSDSTEAAFGADSTGAIVGSETASPLNFLTSGVARGSFQATGAFRLNGSSSGYVGLQGAAAAGSTTFTLPAADGIANQVLRTNGAATLAFGNATQGVYDVTGYGAVADGKVAQDGAMDNNVTFNLTCASAPFTSADVGKAISVSGAGAAGTLAYGTITGFTSSSIVTVSFKNTSGGAISGKTVSWGTDNTTAFTNACAAANTTPSFGAVYVPPGTYRISTHFTVPTGVRVFGNGVGPKWAAYGSVLHQVEGYGSSAGTACVSVAFNGMLEGVAFYSPHQVSSGTPIAYPFTIKGAGYATIRNIFLYNAYQGVDMASESSNPYNGAFTIRGLYGEPLALGIDVNKSYDVSEIADVHFWPFWSLNESTMATWKMNNAIGIRFGRSDYQLMHNIYIGNMGIGVQLNHNALVSAGGTSGTWTNIQLDSAHIGIDAYETGFNGLLISNLFCSGVNIAGTHYGVKTNTDATLYTIISVNNAHMWSNLSYGVYVDNPNGLHSFTQVLFHQAATWHAYINRGSWSITSCQFLATSGSNAVNVQAGCTEKGMLTSNQLFGCTKTISNALTLDANNQA